MSRFDIVYLESYRKRKHARYRCALALHCKDAERRKIIEHLWHGFHLTDADRGAVVWLDEYGPELVHPHTLLDLGADRPRRRFPPALARAAWDTGVPGLLDLSGSDDRTETLGDGIASACVVSLGSDGPRSWFLILDSMTPRSPLTGEAVGGLMFLAGEVASIVLHQDLEHQGTGIRNRHPPQAAVDEGAASFAGWPVLKDLEDHVRTEELEKRIGLRFLVARAVRSLVDDRLVADQESVRQQVQAIRREAARAPNTDPEGKILERVLEALDTPDLEALVSATLEWGRTVDAQGHLNGAQEVLTLAYELAKAMGAAGAAADAARFRGKVHRTRAEWDQALAWYEVAQTIAKEAGDRRKLALVLDGLANAYRDRGNLPLATATLSEVLEIGRETGDRYAMAIGHHDLMTVRKLCGDFAGAIAAGWLAVQSYDSRDGKLRALFDLASVLRESGELSAARDGYSIVADQVQGLEARALALDALAYVAALMGQRSQHDEARARLEALGWEAVSPVYRGQILFYQGLSHRALGEEADARHRLRVALSFAEKHGLNKLVFDVEAALKAAPTERTFPTTAPSWEGAVPEEVLGVRRGLEALKAAPAGVE